jgi:hypothetical protein
MMIIPLDPCGPYFGGDGRGSCTRPPCVVARASGGGAEGCGHGTGRGRARGLWRAGRCAVFWASGVSQGTLGRGKTAKLSGLNLEAYLADILTRIRDHDPAKLDDLLPWNWTAGVPAAAKAA